MKKKFTLKWQLFALGVSLSATIFGQQQLISKAQNQSISITENSQLKQLSDDITLPISIDATNYTLTLHKKSSRSSNYSVEIQNEDGSFTTLPPTPVNTYIGTINELEGYTVGAVINDRKISADIFSANKEHFLLEAENETYKLTTINDEAITCSESCVAPHNEGSIKSSKTLVQQGVTQHNSAKTLNRNFVDNQAIIARALVDNGRETVKQAEIGFDIAWSAYDKHYKRNRDAVLKNIDKFVNNTLNTIWIRDALTEHVTGRIVIRTSAASCPYEKARNRKVNRKTLDQIRFIWNKGTHGKTHNLATLHVGDGVGGLAFVGTISESYKYGAVGQSANAWHGYNRHEVGHNWGA